ncbi:flagellar hook-associated protein FlgK [Mesorhizobium sp. CAU 1741]|uniref:flagellar hook-associated protein FlgK n=1 Tax=Mesorhizobium sp. CAU 1741 TaxID=3140366 RepID=UPI00325B1EF5
MSLSTALNTAQNSLLNTQRQTSVLSRNMANADNPDYNRRTAVLSSLHPGARVVDIQRSTDAALFKQNLTALSGWSAQSKIVYELDRLSLDVNGVDHATSPAMLIGQFQEALQLYSSTPSNRTLAENSIEMAREVVRSLNDGSASIQSFRSQMDGEIAQGVEELNSLLADFKKVNDEIIRASRSGRDALDAHDTRDAILKRVSEFVPISTISRDDNDLMIVTADGTTLFETDPRPVSFEPTVVYGSATVGNRILVDGVPLAKSTGANTTGGGSLAAMVQLRDSFAVEMQSQLDEVARGLIQTFSETDPNPPNDVVAGLFTWPGAPNVPAAGTVETGLASGISLNATVDPSKGGDVERLRDGVAFDFNPDGNASFSEYLIDKVNSLDEPMTFVTNGGVTASQSLMTFSAGSISWLEDARKTASSAAETKSATMFRTSEVLSNLTNVNVDEEMALMLQLEQSYAASAKMMQMIDEMLQTLLSVVR